MIKNFLLLVLFPLSLFASPDVIVSIAPTKYLVQRIGEDKISVDILVPTGANPHAFEPSTKQVIDASHAKIWFTIGEGFEARTGSLFKNAFTVNLQEGLDLLPACKGCPCAGFDTHTWLSPKLLKLQAKKIADTLAQAFPEHATLFHSNLKKLEEELMSLDQEIPLLLSKNASRLILVTHPAFNYFCLDYNLTQLSIEVEGKEPSPKQLTELLFEGRRQNIKTLFVEPQHDMKGAKRLAAELNAQVVSIDPYKENVIENLKEIAIAFGGA